MYPDSPDDSLAKGRNFARHRHDLDVIAINVRVGNWKTNEFYYSVSGFVTNKGEHSWRVKEFELNVSNSQGVVDVQHEEVKNSFVVNPGTVHAFVFHGETILTNQVVAARARVENALDGDVAANRD